MVRGHPEDLRFPYMVASLALMLVFPAGRLLYLVWFTASLADNSVTGSIPGAVGLVMAGRSAAH
jgi:hypothetical protein